MPKIVDHDAYREEIASKAVDVFRRRGYAGIGMRELAQELAMSKSALYHYFPSKESLFLACSKNVASFSLDPSLDPATSIVKLAQQWEEVFPGEMRIMLDYIGERSPAQVKDDEALQLTLRGFEQSLSSVVDQSLVAPILSSVFGFLLLRYIDGHSAPWSELRKLVTSVLPSPQSPRELGGD
ncbi:MAG: TetR/AcrR family transcriptional regulator [Spirochaetales bacterium]